MPDFSEDCIVAQSSFLAVIRAAATWNQAHKVIMANSVSTAMPGSADSSATSRYSSFLMLVAGLGGLLYGVDVGIIGGALPYLEATSHLTPGQLSAIVAAVLLGSVISTLFAGIIADWIG